MGNGRWITAGEAADVAGYASADTFLRWAHRACPEVMHRPVGSKAWRVDSQALDVVLCGSASSAANQEPARPS